MPSPSVQVRGEEYSTLSFEGLAPASDELLNFIGESIVAPGFDAEMLTLWKENQLQAIQKRVFQPRAIGGALFRELLYGGVPYGEPLTSAAITRITPARVKQYYNRFFQPSGAILVISTDREIESIKPLLNNAFGAWSAKVPAVDFPATAPRSAAPGIYFVPRSMAQAIILVGQIGIDRKYPHQLASNTLNRIFGANSFDSRLFREIRTARGLAYNISATINPRLVQGPNLIQVATNADKTGILIDATLRELAMLQKDGVTSTELEKAKLALSHNFILKRPSPFAALKRRAARAILGYPNPDEYGFLKNLHKLSQQQSVSEAATLWRTRELLFVIVGNPIAAKSLAHEIKRKDSMLFELPFYQVDFTEKVDQIRRLNF
jgi:zinc protease